MFIFLCTCFLNFFRSKDVRLPVQLQRAMAAEAEAAREARAKVRLLLRSEQVERKRNILDLVFLSFWKIFIYVDVPVQP